MIRTQMLESTLRTVVGATDFSASADVALSWAMLIGRLHGVPLQLVHAVSRTLPLLHRPDALSSLAEISRGEATAQLARLTDRISSPDQVVTSHLMHDRPSVSILKVAEWTNAGLIVLGRRGQGGVSHLMLGSTAERVAERAVCPVMSVGQGSRSATSLPRRILIATDFSIEADAAVAAAQEICGFGGRAIELSLLTVLDTPEGLERDSAAGRVWWDYVAACRTLLQERLALISSTSESKDFSGQALLREGIPAVEIVREAREVEAELVVMGSRGSFAAGMSFLGSVSKRVMQTARCPVLIVPSLLSKRMRKPLRDL